jgi:hypothetical protein
MLFQGKSEKVFQIFKFMRTSVFQIPSTDFRALTAYSCNCTRISDEGNCDQKRNVHVLSDLRTATEGNIVRAFNVIAVQRYSANFLTE